MASSQIQNKPEQEIAVKTETEKEEEDCINEGTVLSSEEASKYENVINMGGYNYSYTQPETNFQGAAGPGTGSSYASSYYGRQAKKDEKKVCTPKKEVKVIPGMEHKQDNFYTTPENREKRDDLLQEEIDMEWNNTGTADPDPAREWETDETSETDSEQGGETETGTETEYDEVPW